MPQYLARKPLTVNGEDYEPNQPVPLEKMDAELRDKLIDQRRVIPDRIEVKTDDTPLTATEKQGVVEEFRTGEA